MGSIISLGFYRFGVTCRKAGRYDGPVPACGRAFPGWRRICPVNRMVPQSAAFPPACRFSKRKRSRILEVIEERPRSCRLWGNAGVGSKAASHAAAGMTPEQRSASAAKAVRATVDPKAGKSGTIGIPETDVLTDTPSRTDVSDHALAALLTRLRVATDLSEIRLLSEQIERAIFHKQFENA